MTDKLTLTLNGGVKTFEAPQQLSMKALYEAMALSEKMAADASAFEQLDKVMDVALVLLNANPQNHLTKDQLLAGMTSDDFTTQLVPFVQDTLKRLSKNVDVQ